MKAVIKERLDSLVDGVRQALRPGAIFYQTLEAQHDQNRVLLRLRDPAKSEAALAVLRPLVQREGPNNVPDLDIAPAPQLRGPTVGGRNWKKRTRRLLRARFVAKVREQAVSRLGNQPDLRAKRRG